LTIDNVDFDFGIVFLIDIISNKPFLFIFLNDIIYIIATSVVQMEKKKNNI